MLIKVCGMREPENIRAVASLGVVMIGLIFYRKSPRYVQSRIDEEDRLPVQRVGVFVDESIANILKIIDTFHLNYVQLHGNESPQFVTMLRDALKESGFSGVRLMKALSIQTPDEVDRWQVYQGLVDLLLFDTPTAGYGGSGRRFNWSLLAHYQGDIPFLLSGGIGPDDVEDILSFHHPMLKGIDLNSRFELAPAVKDVSLLRGFIHQLRHHG
ncbi:MAG: phosphoribosylanthranilate isomerase [Prevotella sp.]|nr:phosphoribosylanthranilate isomerase [Prevotella sp.]